jgi:predicted metal-dependent phosphoesterase TrpH
MYIDLHTHTTASDGTLSPRQVVQLAKSKGLSAVAITDHDTLSGIDEFMDAGQKEGLEVVPGIEINADFSEGTLHILGYFVDWHTPELRDRLRAMEESRRERAVKMIERLRELGFDVSLDDVVKESDGRLIGRPHFARALARKGYVASLSEAFDKYLHRGKPAYVGREKMNPQTCISLILGAGGIPILAHPRYTERDGSRPLKATLTELIGAGLRGIEVYYPSHTEEMVKRYESLARDLSLLLTGGSDFHGDPDSDVRLGGGPGNLRIPYQLLERLKEERARNRASNPRFSSG